MSEIENSKTPLLDTDRHEGGDPTGPGSVEPFPEPPFEGPNGEGAPASRAHPHPGSAGEGEESQEKPDNRLNLLQSWMERNTGLILEAFEQKLKFDAFKEEQIERLHRELQEYKRDLLAKAGAPLVNGIIRLHDNLGKALDHLRGQDETALAKDLVLEVLDGFADDLEILLEQNGVHLFVQPDERFDPHRQTCRRSIETVDEGLVGCIAERIQPGFQRHGQVIRNEKVAVYVRFKLEHGGENPKPIEKLEQEP